MSAFQRLSTPYTGPAAANARVTLKLPDSAYTYRFIAADLTPGAIAGIPDRKGFDIGLVTGRTAATAAVVAATQTVGLTGSGNAATDTWYGATNSAVYPATATIYAVVACPAALPTATATIFQQGNVAVLQNSVGYPQFTNAATSTSKAPWTTPFPAGVPVILTFVANGANSVVCFGEAESTQDMGAFTASGIISVLRSHPGTLFEAVGYGTAHNAATRKATRKAFRAWYRI